MKRLLPIILILLFLGIHLFIMNDYGLSWDFHHHFFSGGWFLGMSPEILEPRVLPFVLPDARETVKLPYGPFVQIIPTVSWLLFYKIFPILTYDSAYHLPIIFSGIVGIIFLYLFIKEAFGWLQGIIAAIFLFLTPRYFSDLHNNMKDVPSAAIFTLNMWLLYRLIKYQRLKDLILAAIGFMLAFNTKVNAIFIPIIFAVFLFLHTVQPIIKRCVKNILHTLKSSLRIGGHPVEHTKRAMSVKKFLHTLQSNLRIGGSPVEHTKRAMSVINFLRLHFLFRRSSMDKRTPGTEVRKNLLCDYSAPHLTKQNMFLLLSYFLLAPLLAFLLWTLFWGDGIGQIKLMFITFGIGTTNIEVLLNGTIYRSGVNVPWYYAPWYLAITTPIPILILFLVGTVISLWKAVYKSHHASLLLLLWCIVPLLRYLSPKTGVLDGVRHFEEVLFPVAAIAAIGLTTILQTVINKHNKPSIIRKILVTTACSVTLIYLTIPLIQYHPFQLTYYNELVGGIKGAHGLYDLDYWGSSQKYAIAWVNAHAPKNASINIVMTANVGGTYLRDDLIPKLNTTDFLHSDYVVVLNRQSFFNRYVSAYPIGQYISTHTPIYTVTNQGVPLVWVYQNNP